MPVITDKQQHAAVKAVEAGVHGKRTFLDDVRDLTALCAVTVDTDTVASFGDDRGLDTHFGEKGIGGAHVVADGAL